jgi:hypothetical protein
VLGSAENCAGLDRQQSLVKQFESVLLFIEYYSFDHLITPREKNDLDKEKNVLRRR